MIIDWQITIASTKKNKEYFINHPNSHKKVYVRCQMCGNFRWTEYRLAHKLCRSCASKGMKNGKNMDKINELALSYLIKQ